MRMRRKKHLDERLRRVADWIVDVGETEGGYTVEAADYAAETATISKDGVKVTLRAWTKTENYWDVYFDLLEKINAAFDANGITIPFNRLDVHVKN